MSPKIVWTWFCIKTWGNFILKVLIYYILLMFLTLVLLLCLSEVFKDSNVVKFNNVSRIAKLSLIIIFFFVGSSLMDVFFMYTALKFLTQCIAYACTSKQSPWKFYFTKYFIHESSLKCFSTVPYIVYVNEFPFCIKNKSLLIIQRSRYDPG